MIWIEGYCAAFSAKCNLGSIMYGGWRSRSVSVAFSVHQFAGQRGTAQVIQIFKVTKLVRIGSTFQLEWAPFWWPVLDHPSYIVHLSRSPILLDINDLSCFRTMVLLDVNLGSALLFELVHCDVEFISDLLADQNVTSVEQSGSGWIMGAFRWYLM